MVSFIGHNLFEPGYNLHEPEYNLHEHALLLKPQKGLVGILNMILVGRGEMFEGYSAEMSTSANGGPSRGSCVRGHRSEDPQLR